MIRDLDLAGNPVTRLACEVLIVGAGLAGIAMAAELARRGVRVVVVESGGKTQDAEFHLLNRVVQTAQVYSGAESGRFRCLGGTSTRWGGAMMPFQPEDLGPHTAGWGDAWPLRLDELLPHLATVERHFSLPTDSYETPDLLAQRAGSPCPEFMVRAAKWPPFASRNIAHVFDAQLGSDTGPEVWLNATVTSMVLDERGAVSRVHASSTSGKSLELSPWEVVMAAGAIESTRLLLALDADHDQRVFAPDDVIGRYFHDHLSAPVAEVAVSDRQAFQRLVGFRFQGAAMRNSRFELSGRARVAQRLPGAFAHVAFSTDGRSGFDGLREVLRALQRRQLPHGADLGLIAANAGWFARAGWWRFIHQRVLPPDEARYQLHLVTEQRPTAGNRITLSASQRDIFGVPLASLDWRVSTDDITAAEQVMARLLGYWRSTGLADLGELIAHPTERWSQAMVSGGGIYHPGGSLRMGLTAKQGVVAGDLRSFAVPNLRVVSTAVFPSGGGANPSLMLLLMAFRAADDILAARTNRHGPG